jgi:hypothetical protein
MQGLLIHFHANTPSLRVAVRFADGEVMPFKVDRVEDKGFTGFYAPDETPEDPAALQTLHYIAFAHVAKLEFLDLALATEPAALSSGVSPSPRSRPG